MNPINFERNIFNGLVLPGIAVMILFILTVRQPWFSTSLFVRDIGGPAGMVIGIGLLPLAMMFLIYIVLSMMYSVLLPLKYFWGKGGFIKAIRRFVLLSDVFFIVMDILLLFAYLEVARWNYISMLNLPFVLSLTAMNVIMSFFFVFWTIRIYRHENLKFISWKTSGELLLCLFILQLPAISLLIFLAITELQ